MDGNVSKPEVPVIVCLKAACSTLEMIDASNVVTKCMVMRVHFLYQTVRI
jgi:hypothetical protein